MTDVHFKQVDVFTERPFYGNPVACVLEPGDLSTEDMQRIAAWTNLSETTFVLPSARADYRLRIFSPRRELPFAGHPTVGSAHAVIEAGIVVPRGGRLTQECLAGVIDLRVESDGRIAVRVPPAKLVRDADVDPGRVAQALGAALATGSAPMPVDVGPVWLIAQAASADALAAAQPDFVAIAALSREHRLTGITAFALEIGGVSSAHGARVKVRSFAPGEGITEDPVCGSGNAAVGAYIAAHRLLAEAGAGYVASQGREMGRDGRVHVVAGHEQLEISGHAVSVIDGTMRLH
jgi:PhzF family phenazine biosynthesis protein